MIEVEKAGATRFTRLFISSKELNSRIVRLRNIDTNVPQMPNEVHMLGM